MGKLVARKIEVYNTEGSRKLEHANLLVVLRENTGRIVKN